jgi:hypothetical protein
LNLVLRSGSRHKQSSSKTSRWAKVPCWNGVLLLDLRVGDTGKPGNGEAGAIFCFFVGLIVISASSLLFDGLFRCLEEADDEDLAGISTTISNGWPALSLLLTGFELELPILFVDDEDEGVCSSSSSSCC